MRDSVDQGAREGMSRSRGDWSTATLDFGTWCNTVSKGGRRFMTVWERGEEKACKTRWMERDRKGRQGRGLTWGDSRKLESF